MNLTKEDRQSIASSENLAGMIKHIKAKDSDKKEGLNLGNIAEKLAQRRAKNKQEG